jgi:uncharacterized protein (UPF0261 family)
VSGAPRPPEGVAIVATLDTKGAEVDFLRAWFAQRGLVPRLVDVGTVGPPLCALGDHDAPRDQVASLAGTSVAELPLLRRDVAMAAMGQGAGRVLRRWSDEGTLAGALGLGGNQGTAIACLALRAVPVGVPKVMVSTVASGNIRPFIGASDITMVCALADLLGGPNRITRGVLVRAAGMLAGAIEAARADVVAAGAHARPAVALTTLGNTHAAAVRIMAALGVSGFEAVPFHASGAGGSAMEALVDRGAFAGVIDLTPHELLGELFGDDIYAPVGVQRLAAAGRRGLPMVVAPGGLDYFVFGPPDSVPPRYAGRPTHYHNPYNTNVRATPDELTRVGRVLAERLNEAAGPSALLYPLRGWSQIGREGGPLWDAAGNEALRRAVREGLRVDRVRYGEVDAAINDPAFADEVVATFLDLTPARV